MTVQTEAILKLSNYSTFNRIQRVTAWIFRFIHNCRTTKIASTTLSVSELSKAESYWLSVSQNDLFPQEVKALKSNHSLPSSISLIPFNPFIDQDGLVRVGGRLANSTQSYKVIHPIILHADYRIAKLLIRLEHVRLLHAGPTLSMSSIGLRYRIIGLRRTVRSIIRACVTCKRHTRITSHQLQGQLPRNE